MCAHTWMHVCVCKYRVCICHVFFFLFFFASVSTVYACVTYLSVHVCVYIPTYMDARIQSCTYTCMHVCVCKRQKARARDFRQRALCIMLRASEREVEVGGGRERY